MLLVLDDAWNAEHVTQVIGGGPRCAVLLTTREAVVARAARASAEDTIEVGVMTRDEGLAVLAGGPDRLLGAGERAQALEVARAVGFLPLALNLARAQIADGVSWSELALELRRETQLLEALDDAALETIVDESTRRQLSLIASVSVSLRRLSPERLQQVAWLGVLPDDVQLPASAAATLWAVDEASARLAMRSLRSSGLLLAGERTADGALTYLPHDVIHAMAKRLLVAPEDAARAAQLPGLGLTAQSAQRAFLARHRARCSGDGWHTLQDDSYIFDHLTWHLEHADRVEDIHALLREQGETGGNGWFEAREQLGHTSAYASDLRHALRLSGSDLGLGLRYALMLASLRSLATAVPPALLMALLEQKLWSLPQALAYASQSVDPGQRSRALMLIAERQPPAQRAALLLEAFAAAQDLNDDTLGVRTLLASELAGAGLTDEALELARKAEDGDPRISALAAVVPHLGEERRRPVIAEALESSRKTSELFRAAALEPILPWLEAAQVRGLIAGAAEMEAEFFKGQVLADLAVRLAELGETDDALGTAEAILEPTSRAQALAGMAAHVPEALRAHVTNRALDLAAAVNDEAWSNQLETALGHMNEAARALVLFSQRHTSWRANLLATLQGDMAEPVQKRAVELALGDEDPLTVARNFAALAPRLDAGRRRDGLQQIVDRLSAADAPATTVEGLATLLPYADIDRGALFERVWHELSGIERDVPREEALQALLPALQQGEFERALEMIAALDDADLRGQLIESIATLLPVRLVSRTRDIARAVGDHHEQLFTQASLAAHLDVTSAAAVLKSADRLSPKVARAAVLSAFPDAFASQLFDQALKVDQERADKSNLALWQVRTYAPLVAPERRLELFTQAAAAVEAGDDLDAMCEVLRAAAELLPAADVISTFERLLARASGLPGLPIGLASVRLRIAAWPSLDADGKAALRSAAYQTAFEQVGQKGESPDGDLLEFLVQESPPASLDLLLQLFDEIADPFERARAYGRALPAAPAARRDELVRRALDHFDQVEGDEYLTADEKAQIIGARVLPYTPNAKAALDVISGFEGGQWRAEALIAIAPKVDVNTFDQALGIAATLEPHERGQAMLALEGAAPAATASSLLQEAWEVAMQSASDLHHDRLLAALTGRMCKLEPDAARDFLKERLTDLAGLSRQQLLIKLKYLAPALLHAGGRELVTAVYHAIDDVERWWP